MSSCIYTHYPGGCLVVPEVYALVRSSGRRALSYLVQDLLGTRPGPPRPAVVGVFLLPLLSFRDDGALETNERAAQGGGPRENCRQAPSRDYLIDGGQELRSYSSVPSISAVVRGGISPSSELGSCSEVLFFIAEVVSARDLATSLSTTAALCCPFVIFERTLVLGFHIFLTRF